MNDINPVLLALSGLLGGSGLTAFGALAVRALFQALKVTSSVQSRQEKEIERLTEAVTRKDDEIDRLRGQLLARDIEIARLKGAAS